MLTIVAAFCAGIIILSFVMKMLTLPMRLFGKFITNSFIGAVLLALVQLVGLSVHVNILTALIAGAFGIPGVIAVVLWSYL